MEIWKAVKGYEGLYEISNKGNLKSLPKTKGFYSSEEIICTPSISKGGYLHMNLFKDGKFKKYFIHKLVAETFIKNEDGKTHVSHKDHNRLNNNVENLKWSTASEILKDAYDQGLRQPTVSSKFAIKAINIITGEESIYRSITKAYQETHISKNIIKECLNGTRNNYKNLQWRFLNEY